MAFGLNIVQAGPMRYSGPGFTIEVMADDSGRKALEQALELVAVSREVDARHAPTHPFLLAIEPAEFAIEGGEGQ